MIFLPLFVLVAFLFSIFFYFFRVKGKRVVASSSFVLCGQAGENLVVTFTPRPLGGEREGKDAAAVTFN